jgi:peptidoglycan/LPS O-acetylase OafA/YrhL
VIVRSVVRWVAIIVGLVACGIAVAALVIAYGEYSETHWVPPARWVGLAVYTLLIFGTLIRDFRPSWGRAGFWATLAGLFAAHLVAYAIVLRSTPEWRLIWFLPMSLAEFPILMSILSSLGYRDSPLKRRRRENA